MPNNRASVHCKTFLNMFMHQCRFWWMPWVVWFLWEDAMRSDCLRKGVLETIRVVGNWQLRHWTDFSFSSTVQSLSFSHWSAQQRHNRGCCIRRWQYPSVIRGIIQRLQIDFLYLYFINHALCPAWRKVPHIICFKDVFRLITVCDRINKRNDKRNAVAKLSQIGVFCCSKKAMHCKFILLSLINYPCS